MIIFTDFCLIELPNHSLCGKNYSLTAIIFFALLVDSSLIFFYLASGYPNYSLIEKKGNKFQFSFLFFFFLKNHFNDFVYRGYSSFSLFGKSLVFLFFPHLKPLFSLILFCGATAIRGKPKWKKKEKNHNFSSILLIMFLWGTLVTLYVAKASSFSLIVIYLSIPQLPSHGFFFFTYSVEQWEMNWFFGIWIPLFMFW